MSKPKRKYVRKPKPEPLFTQKAEPEKERGADTLGYEEDGDVGFKRNKGDVSLYVSETGAMNLSAVFASVDLYCRSIKSFPLITYQDLDEGGRERAKDHPAYRVLKTSPNDYTTARTFWALAVRKLLCKGNFFAEIVRLNNGDLHELHYLPNEAIEVKTEYAVDPSTGLMKLVKYFNIKEKDGNGFKETRVEAGRILHLFINSDNGIDGVGIIEQASRSFGVANGFEKATESALKKMVSPMLVISSPNGVDKNKRKTLKESYENEIAGVENTGGLLILDLASTADTLSLNAEEFAFLEQRRYQDEIIARWFGLTPSMIGDQSSSHYNALGMDNQFLIQRALAPMCGEMSAQINQQIFFDDVDIYCEFLFDSLLQGLTTERYQAYAVAIQSGWMLRSEVRQKENMPAIEGLDEPKDPVNLGGSAAPGQVDFNAKELDTPKDLTEKPEDGKSD